MFGKLNMRNAALYAVAATTLIGAVFAVFWPGLTGDYIFDDYPNLVNDPDWKMTSLSIEQLIRTVLSGTSGLGGRPLALLSFGLNHYFAGPNPFALKSTNLAMHALNSALAFGLCDKFFALATPADGRVRMGRFAAWAVALAWALHPIQLSTVLYTVQRMEIGAATGTLLALSFYLQARTRQMDGRACATWFLAAGLAGGIGLGFKETALLTPGYALLVEVFLLGFRNRHGARSKLLVSAYAIAIAAASLFFLFAVLPAQLRPEAYAMRDFTLQQRLATQPLVLLTYLKQLLVPLPGHFPFYYDRFPISDSFASVPALFASLALASLLVAAAIVRHRLALVAFGVYFFFVAHALTSNVVPFELAFEHRNYLALLGIAIAVAQLCAWATRTMHLDARRTMACVCIAASAWLCHIQARTWGDPMQLAMALAARAQESPRASLALGRTMLQFAGSDAQSPLWSMARDEFVHAAELPGSPPLAEQAIIIMDSGAKRAVPFGIWSGFQRKLAAKAATPESESALYSILSCRRSGRCVFDDSQLQRSFDIALERNPKSASIRALYAIFAFDVAGDRKLGIEMMRAAVALDPGEIQYKSNLALFLATSGHRSEEVEALEREVRSANLGGRYDRDLERLARVRASSKTGLRESAPR